MSEVADILIRLMGPRICDRCGAKIHDGYGYVVACRDSGIILKCKECVNKKIMEQ